ncbi:MAG: DUF2188 domain-containing protein [Thermoplasmatales archaeon]|nr:MAG: DUF2188 domain-containing protein [Thermoplasmatales archaeon]
MARWKLFGKSKEEKIKQTKEQKKEETQTPIVESKSSENKPLTEYHETLKTGKQNIKKETTSSYIYRQPSDQRIWRDVNTIEENVDNINLKKEEESVSNLDKKVDELIEKSKQKHTRKTSNVIYVVSKPQSGEVKGDWAVRSHGKIYSHHKTKKKAIEEARKIAVKKDATVMVQNTDGTFSNGFKPR